MVYALHACAERLKKLSFHNGTNSRIERVRLSPNALKLYRSYKLLELTFVFEPSSIYIYIFNILLALMSHHGMEGQKITRTKRNWERNAAVSTRKKIRVEKEKLKVRVRVQRTATRTITEYRDGGEGGEGKRRVGRGNVTSIWRRSDVPAVGRKKKRVHEARAWRQANSCRFHLHETF